MTLFSWKITLSIPLGVLVLLGVLGYCDSSPIVFESLESKTRYDEPVYNRISYSLINQLPSTYPFKFQERWTMQQSHNGNDSDYENWERISITMDENNALFQQWEPGGSTINKYEKEIDYKIPCAICHNNGPRAIRPNYHSPTAPVSPWNRWRITLWNLRIKFYKGVVQHESETSLVPLAFEGKFANEELAFNSCSQCHDTKGYVSRNALTRQMRDSIKFLVKNGLMPPTGHKISKEDREKIMRL